METLIYPPMINIDKIKMNANYYISVLMHRSIIFIISTFKTDTSEDIIIGKKNDNQIGTSVYLNKISRINRIQCIYFNKMKSNQKHSKFNGFRIKLIPIRIEF